MNSKKFTILKDTREKTGWKFRSSTNCHGMIKEKLNVGDYSIRDYEHLIFIERKTITDLWGTLVQGRVRFEKELERAKDHKVKIVIIEGTLKEVMAGIRFSKVSPEFILGKLISMQVKHNIHVIFADKRIDVTQKFVRKLLSKLFKYCEDGIIK